MTETANTTSYVIQKHTTDDDVHWDLMIERDGVLATWRVGVSPKQMLCNTLTITKIHDHEMRFLTYQGPVNKGTGDVTIADKGICVINQWTDNRITGFFDGDKLNTQFQMDHLAADEWQLKRLPLSQ